MKDRFVLWLEKPVTVIGRTGFGFTIEQGLTITGNPEELKQFVTKILTYAFEEVPETLEVEDATIPL